METPPRKSGRSRRPFSIEDNDKNTLWFHADFKKIHFEQFSFEDEEDRDAPL